MLHLRNRHAVGTGQGFHPEILNPDFMIILNLLHPGINQLALLHIVLADRT